MDSKTWPVWKTITLGINQDIASEIITAELWNHDENFIDKVSQQNYSLEPEHLP